MYGFDTFQPPPPVVVLPSPQQAWSLLANGYDQQAAQDFQVLAGADPGNGSYFVGAALAQALQGDDAAAVAQMQYGLSLRAEALLAVPTDPALRSRLESMAARLKDRSKMLDGTLAGRDALFMLAAVQTILYENGKGYFSVTTAIERGDRTPAALNLKSMLAGRMSV